MRVLLFALSASSVAAFAPNAGVRRTFTTCGFSLRKRLHYEKIFGGFVGWLEAVWGGATRFISAERLAQCHYDIMIIFYAVAVEREWKTATDLKMKQCIFTRENFLSCTHLIFLRFLSLCRIYLPQCGP